MQVAKVGQVLLTSLEKGGNPGEAQQWLLVLLNCIRAAGPPGGGGVAKLGQVLLTSLETGGNSGKAQQWLLVLLACACVWGVEGGRVQIARTTA